ncbi:hypothetical protein [Coleofasciculus chthonoplastes]|uniref:hypothetical protein n=1 Tax=Coleofasciculus chthonoplastes TaxID=64178 RepID=UPI00330225AD
MKVSVTGDKTRKIASKEHNTYVAEGVDRHKATQTAPSSLLKPFPEDLQHSLLARQKSIETQLCKFFGDPFYCNHGFILYKGDSVDLLQKLEWSNIKLDLTVTSPPYNIGKEYEEIMSVDEYIGWCCT